MSNHHLSDYHHSWPVLPGTELCLVERGELLLERGEINLQRGRVWHTILNKTSMQKIWDTTQ